MSQLTCLCVNCNWYTILFPGAAQQSAAISHLYLEVLADLPWSRTAADATREKVAAATTGAAASVAEQQPPVKPSRPQQQGKQGPKAGGGQVQNSFQTTGQGGNVLCLAWFIANFTPFVHATS
jgi:hypothetical protein